MKHSYHKDINHISVNRLIDRNFYCPKRIHDKKSVYKGGSRITLLNGDWDFHYYLKNEKFNINDSFNKIKVPCNYQVYGYGNICYVNDHYLIDIKPPFIDDSNYGVYRKSFIFKKNINQKYYLNFEGKDSCIYVYLNNHFIGFDQVSHCTSEFDITKYLYDGVNEIIVFVYETCVGTYFECQDKFRLSGLFRDVYILERDIKHITSYYVNYVKDNNDVNVTIDFIAPKLIKTIEVFDASNNKIINIKSSSNKIAFTIKNAKLWNNEEPYLYNMTIKTGDEVIYDYIALRFIELSSCLKINDREIKLLGVNHHDSNYETGFYLSKDDYIRDIQIMKEHHINAVRTSHYPSSPEFLYLCDEYGLYVMLEADIECHGIVRYSGQYDANDFDIITDNPIFEKVIFDRLNRSMMRDHNRFSIISFSAGNESGYGQIIIKGIKMMKEKESQRFIHYESLYTSHSERNNYKLDLISQMYSSLEKMDETIKKDNRPLLLCEFSHAMGNSCGDIHDYVEYFYNHKQCIGGFVWEFNDHLFPINFNKNTPGYGGDFNESIHSGNFCVDGLIDYKRKPHTSMLELKSAYSELKIKKDGNNYYLISRFNFHTVNNIIVYYNDHKLKIDSLSPHGEVLICANDEPVLNFKVFVNSNLYYEESFVKDMTIDLSFEPCKFQILEKERELIITKEKLFISINKNTGLIKEIIYDNESLSKDVNLLLIRAPIDNDQYEIDKWNKYGLFNYNVQCSSYVIDSKKIIANIAIDNILKGKIEYSINNNSLKISLNLNINNEIEYLPRLGLDFKINKKFNKYSYIGYGPYESYLDKHYLDTFGEFNDCIKSEIDYIKPQENNSHLANEISLKKDNLKIQVKGFSSFNYSPYSINELSSKKHCYDLIEDSYNHLILDYKMSGIGSNSCGPQLDTKYKFTEKKINYEIIIGVKQ